MERAPQDGHAPPGALHQDRRGAATGAGALPVRTEPPRARLSLIETAYVAVSAEDRHTR